MRVFMFEKPLGMRDTLPDVYKTKRALREAMMAEMEMWGYSFIETPTLEYDETVGAASAILDQQLFKLLDREGHTLVLRPDMTAPIARLAASKLYKEGCPLRLAYAANVFRAQQREGGRPAEFEQVGVEYIGDGTMYADAEVISLMIFALKRAGLRDFTVTIGHIGYVDALFFDILRHEQRVETLRRFLYEKNYVGYREHVKSLPLSSIDRDRLLRLLTLRGGEEVVAEAKAFATTEEERRAVEELEQLWMHVKQYGVTDMVKLDMSLVSHMSYYTGILFEVYAKNIGFLLGNGGRYDELLGKFHRPSPATGFSVRLDRLMEAIGEQHRREKTTCIIFSQERFAEAYAKAAEMRKKGEKVVLQHVAGVGDMDQFTASFDDVEYVLGKRGKDEQSC